jgi:hypothetical protein
MSFIQDDLSPTFNERGLCCGQTRYGDAVGRAANVIKTILMAKGYGTRLAAMFAADADF